MVFMDEIDRGEGQNNTKKIVMAVVLVLVVVIGIWAINGYRHKLKMRGLVQDVILAEFREFHQNGNFIKRESIMRKNQEFVHRHEEVVFIKIDGGYKEYEVCFYHPDDDKIYTVTGRYDNDKQAIETDTQSRKRTPEDEKPPESEG